MAYKKKQWGMYLIKSKLKGRRGIDTFFTAINMVKIKMTIWIFFYIFVPNLTKNNTVNITQNKMYHQWVLRLSARLPTAPATECLATECHVDPVPQATKCPVVIECPTNFSQMSVHAGWPCLWVHSALGTGMPYNRRKTERLAIFSVQSTKRGAKHPTLLIALISWHSYMT